MGKHNRVQRIEMEETFENHELSKQTVENPIKNYINLNKCSQCDYASINKGHLRAHIKAHIGEKSNKCNQCDYETAYISALGAHVKTHSGEKSNKCNQCDFASSQAGNRGHI